MRVYIRIDPELVEKKSSYPDGALVAFISAICAAEQQPQRGRFKTAKILKAYLGTRARWMKYLISHGDLVELENGALYVDGWDEWQEGDWKVNERVQRIRNRQRVTPHVTVPVTPHVTVPVTAPRRPLTVQDSPSEPLAVSRKPLATSEHGDAVGVGEQVNGAATATGPSPQVQVVRLLDWFLAKRGWSTWGSDEVQKREAQQAVAIVELGIPLADVVTKLDAMWTATDPDDRPSSLKYFWTRLQDEQHATLKQDRSHASSGLTKLEVPAAVKRRGERSVTEGEA